MRMQTITEDIGSFPELYEKAITGSVIQFDFPWMFIEWSTGYEGIYIKNLDTFSHFFNGEMKKIVGCANVAEWWGGRGGFYFVTRDSRELLFFDNHGTLFSLGEMDEDAEYFFGIGGVYFVRGENSWYHLSHNRVGTYLGAYDWEHASVGIDGLYLEYENYIYYCDENVNSLREITKIANAFAWEGFREAVIEHLLSEETNEDYFVLSRNGVNRSIRGPSDIDFSWRISTEGIYIKTEDSRIDLIVIK